MHHNRSLLPDVEVLLNVMVKTLWFYLGNNFKTVRITITYYNLTDAVFAEKTIPQMRFLQVLTCMFDMSTMLKLC